MVFVLYIIYKKLDEYRPINLLIRISYIEYECVCVCACAYVFFCLLFTQIFWFHDIDITVSVSVPTSKFIHLYFCYVYFVFILSIMKSKFDKLYTISMAEVEREKESFFVPYQMRRHEYIGWCLFCWCDDGASPFPIKCAMKWSAIGSWIYILVGKYKW